jgi:excisionase family DNA binding protein
VTEKLLLTYEEAAERTSVSKSYLYALVNRGKLPCVRLPGTKEGSRGPTRLHIDDVDELARTYRTTVNGPKAGQSGTTNEKRVTPL